jgi:hypothetical protein
MNCTCWICWGDAWRKGIYGDWDELECLGCGRYRISRRFLTESRGKTFDVQKMRSDFERLLSSGHVPVVNYHNARFTGKVLKKALTTKL